MSTFSLKVIKSAVLNPQSLIPLPDSGEAVLGRKADQAQLVVPEPSISRQHCKFSVENQILTLTDLGSGNGTLVNGKRISAPTILKQGDTIRTGDTQFEVSAEEEAKTQIAPPPEKKPKPHVPPTHRMNATKASPRFNAGDIVAYIKARPVVAAVAALILCIVVYIMSLSPGAPASRLPTPADCIQTYALKDWPFQIQYPRGWDVLKRSRSDVFGHSYNTLSTHLIGNQYQGMDALIFMQTLEGIPPKFNIHDVIDTQSKFFPRALSQDKALIQRHTMEINGRQWTVGETPVFTLKEKSVRSLEAFYLENGTRYLIIFHTSDSLFETLKPVFMHILAGVKLVPHQDNKIISNPSDEITNLIKLADSMISNRVVQPDNIFFALKNYRQAALTFNAYMYEPDNAIKAKLESKIKESNQLLNAELQLLKVELKKGMKLKDYRSAYEAASRIRAILPDPSDERYKDADYYYELLKSKFGNK